MGAGSGGVTKLRFLPHAQYYRALGEHYAHAFCIVRGCLVRKFWAAKVGGRSSSLGVRRVSGAHPGGFREAPRKQTRGQTQHYKAHTCTLCRNKHRQSVAGQVTRSDVDMSAHVPTFDTCALTRLGSLALVRMNPRLTRLPMHTVQSSHGRELSAGWVGSRGFQWIGSRV